jgi:hypothetical protein
VLLCGACSKTRGKPGLGCTHLEPLCDLKQRGLVFLVPARWRGHGSTLASRGHGAKRYRCHTTHSLTNTHTHTLSHSQHTLRNAHRHFSVLGPLQQLSLFWPQVFTQWAQTAPQTAPHTHTPPSASRGSRPSPFTLFSNGESRLIPAPPVWLLLQLQLLRRTRNNKRWRSFV